MQKRKRNKTPEPSANGRPSNVLVVASQTEALKLDLLALAHELESYREETRVQTEHLVKTQEMLEKSRDRYADLFDFAPMPYLILDRWGVITETNLPAAALLKCERTRMVGFPLRRFVQPEDRRGLLNHMHRCRSESGRVTSELSFVTVDGKSVPVELTSRRALAEYEKREVYPTAVADLTERQQAVTVRNELLAHLMTAEEQERQRLSRELHDVLGQHVTALMLGLRLLEKEVSAPVQKKIGDLLLTADALGQDAHRLALNLRPTALDDLGLASALASYIDDWSARTAVPTRFHCVGASGPRLPPHLETVFYRVAQEALTNIAKHAQARQVNLLLNVTASEASLIIEDDGRGLDAQLVFEAAARNKRLGLFGMRERVSLAGGTLHIESAPQKGTTLFVRVPLKRGGGVFWEVPE
jgi:PAS domain S-box-containing protein